MWRLDTTATATRGYRRFAVGTRPECTVFGKRVVGRKAAGKRGAVAVVGSAESQARVHLDRDDVDKEWMMLLSIFIYR